MLPFKSHVTGSNPVSFTTILHNLRKENTMNNYWESIITQYISKYSYHTHYSEYHMYSSLRYYYPLLLLTDLIYVTVSNHISTACVVIYLILLYLMYDTF